MIKLRGAVYLGGLSALYNGQGNKFKGALLFDEKGVRFSQLAKDRLVIQRGAITSVMVGGVDSTATGPSALRLAAIGLAAALAPGKRSGGDYVAISIDNGETGIFQFPGQRTASLQAALSPWLAQQHAAEAKQQAEQAALKAQKERMADFTAPDNWQTCPHCSNVFLARLPKCPKCGLTRMDPVRRRR